MKYRQLILSILLMLALTVSFATAETADKYVVDGEKTILIDEPEIVIYLTGKNEAIDNCNGISGNFMFKLGCVVENKSDEAIGSIMFNGVINGWSLGSNYTMSNTSGIQPGTKVKTEIWFTTEGTEISSLEELESMNLTFVVEDENYQSIIEVSTGEVHFHASPEDAAQPEAEAPAVEEAPAAEPAAEEAPTAEPAADEAPAVEAADEAPTAEPAAEEAPAAEPAVEEAPAAEAVEYETLEIGSKGDAVVALQKHLIALGYLNGAADGIYGKGTAGGVSRFQAAEGLAETGIADSETQARLFAKEIPLTMEELLAQNLTIETEGTVKLGSNRAPNFEKKGSFSKPGPEHWYANSGERETLAVLMYFDLYKTVDVSDSLFGCTYIANLPGTDDYILCYTSCASGQDCWLTYTSGDSSAAYYLAEALDAQRIEEILAEGGFQYAQIDKSNVIQIVQMMS